MQTGAACERVLCETARQGAAMKTTTHRLRRRSIAALSAVLIATAVAGAVPTVASAATRPGLLARYQPVTYLAPGEHFAPVAVETLVRQAALETRDASGAFVVADPS